MFDVSWVDPARETVGQRKNRKEQQYNGQSKGSSTRTSFYSDYPGTPQQWPSMFTLSNSHKKGLRRSGSHSKLSALRTEQSAKSSRRMSSYTITSDSSTQEIPPRISTMTPRISINKFVGAGSSYNINMGHSSPSDGSISIKVTFVGRY